MHDVLLWFWWLKAQLEKPDANPAEIYREHRGAFALAHAVFRHHTVLWFQKTGKQKVVYKDVREALAYFEITKLNVKSRAKALRLVNEAVSALEAAGYDIPF